MLIDITEPVVQLLGYGLTVDGSASLSSDSSLVSAATITAFAEASLSGESSLVAAATATRFVSASMSAEVTLTINVKIVYAAASIIVGSSNLTAESTRIQFVSAQPMSSDSSVTATLLLVKDIAARPMEFSSNLTATVYIPSRYLVLPTIELAYTDNVLLSRYPIDNGQALLITGTSGELLTFPAQEAITDADYYFRGGATNILDDESEAAVVAAGYGQYIVVE
jgi:hypothetical protein